MSMILHEYNIDDGVARRLPSPGKCIYCGESDVELTDEHVIPYAIGKDAIILEKACCTVCRNIIQRYEQEVLRKQLGVFRAMVASPTRRKKERPTTVTLSFSEMVDEERRLVRDLGTREISLKDAPLILNLWRSPPPRILGEAIDPKDANGSAWRYVEQVVVDRIIADVARETGSQSAGITLAPVNRLHYLRSLAKTAHAYVAAELGVDAFEPFLIDLILNRSDDVAEFVGDAAGVASLEGATGHDFKITLGKVVHDTGPDRGWIVVFMQMWGDLKTPPHIVIVGRTLVSLGERFRQVKLADSDLTAADGQRGIGSQEIPASASAFGQRQTLPD